MPERQAQMTTTMAAGRSGFAGRRCLVLGGGGFIGTNLSRGLVTAGAQVTAFGKVIFVSSGGTVYGVPEHLPICESHPTDPISAYGISKLAIEKYLGLYRRLHGLDYCVLRVANPYGPYQVPFNNQGVVASILQRALSGEAVEIWGDGEIVRDFIHIDDVVDTLIAAVDYAGPKRVFNVGSGIGRSVNQIITDVETVLKLGPIARDYKPARPADVPVNVLDIGLIQREMGWRPCIDWLEGLRSTGSWMTRWLATQPVRRPVNAAGP